jgi:hypothetical protein
MSQMVLRRRGSTNTTASRQRTAQGNHAAHIDQQAN